MKLKSGFSLIELLVVVAIIGILAAIGTVGYNKYTEDANSAVYKANDKQIMEALLAEDASQTSALCTEGAISCASAVAGNANITQWSSQSVVCDQNTLKITIGAQVGTLGRMGC